MKKKLIEIENKGFTLVEILISLSLLAVLNVAILNLIDNVNTVKTDIISTSAMDGVIFKIRSDFYNKAACDNSFSGDIRTLSGKSIILKDASNKEIFSSYPERVDSGLSVNDIVLNGAYDKETNEYLKVEDGLSLNEMDGRYYGMANLTIEFKKGSGKKVRTIYRDVPIYLITGNNYVLDTCLGPADNVTINYLKKSCDMFNGTFDAENQICELPSDLSTPIANNIAASTLFVKNYMDDLDFDDRYINRNEDDTLTGNLIVTKKVTAKKYCIDKNCISTFAVNNCPEGQLMSGVDNKGDPICKNITCSQGKYLVGIDASGPICTTLPSRSCGVNEYIYKIKNDGSVLCRPFVNVNAKCPSGQFLRTLSSDGNYSCTAGLGGKKCSGSSYVKGIDSKQNLICSSCSPSCPKANTICKGDKYTGGNGCGGQCNVSGTKTSGNCQPQTKTYTKSFKDVKEGTTLHRCSGTYSKLQSCSGSSKFEKSGDRCKMGQCSGDHCEGRFNLTAVCSR